MSHSDQHASASIKEQPPNYRFATEAYDHFQVISIDYGRLEFTTAEAAHVLRAGSVLVLRAGSAFTLRTDGKTGYSGVCFNALAHDDPGLRGNSVAFLAEPPLRSMAEYLTREARTPGLRGGEMLRHLGWAFALLALRAAATTRTASSQPDYGRYWTERAKEALAASVYAPTPARQVLAGFPLSYRQLARHFAAATGISPKQYQIAARIREAQRLLAATRLPITAIAFELGYPSSQHFASQFRAIIGRSPREWRRQQRSK